MLPVEALGKSMSLPSLASGGLSYAGLASGAPSYASVNLISAEVFTCLSSLVCLCVQFSLSYL